MWYVTVLAVLLLYACLPALAEEEEAPELPNFDRMWDFSKPDQTEKRFRELLPRAEASGDLDYHLQLLTQIARTQGLQGRFDDAHATLDGVEQNLDEASPATRIRYLLERGRTLNSSKQKEKARALFLEAWELGCEKKVDFYALDAAHMMEIVEPKENKLEWNEKAMKLAETSEDERTKLWLGALYNNRGWALFELERYEEALEIHKKGWEWRKQRAKEAGREDVDEPTLIAKWCVARMLRALERYEEALAMQREILETRTKLELGTGFAHEELAENLLALGKAEEAKPHFVEAWKQLEGETWIEESEPERYARLRRMAGADAQDAQEPEDE